MHSERAELVSYRDIRLDIKNGDIILFRGRTLLSRLIRWVTRSTYSHVGIVAWWNERLIVLEATAPGVIARPLSRVVQIYDGNLELWTTDAALDRDAAIRAAMLELGKRYATVALFRVLRKIVIGVKQQPDPWRPPDKFICSQFVSYAWRAGGVDLAENESDEFTTPAHIARASAMRLVGALCVDDTDQASGSKPEGPRIALFRK